MSKSFNYGKAEADLEEAGCFEADEIYGYRSEERINGFMRENGLNPDRYYTKRPDKGKNSGKSSQNNGCYLTTACVEAKGLPDDCYELRVLREFRDTYLMGSSEGKQDVAEYYRTAPKIVEHISESSEAKAVWDRIYHGMILPCISMIEQGRKEDAYASYKAYTLELEAKWLC